MAEASFSDLQNAIRGFNDEVKTYNIQKTINTARDQLGQLQQAQMDETERRVQLRQFSDQLAMQLTGMGATGAQIETAISASRPRALNTPSDMYAEGLMKSDEGLKKSAREFKNFQDENKIEMERMKLAARQMTLAERGAREDAKLKLGQDRTFANLVKSKGDMYARWNEKLGDQESKLGMLLQGLRDNNNEILQRAAPTITVKAMGEVGALTEADKEPFQGSMALSRRLEQLVSTAATGKLSEHNRKLMIDLAEKLLQNMSDRKARNLKILGGQLRQTSNRILNSPLSEAEAESFLTGQDVQPAAQSNTSAAPATQSTSSSSNSFNLQKYMLTGKGK